MKSPSISKDLILNKIIMRKVYIPRGFVTVIFLLMITLSACVWPKSEDPFERLPEEETIMLEGEIFPFSVSVATRATHRLEKDGKLQTYLASDVVQLGDFEGVDVMVEGVVRNEKMREILWVQSIKIAESEDKLEEVVDPLFHTKEIAFRHPASWVYTTAPNGVAYFSEESDANRMVFFTFGVENFSGNKSEIDPDIMISNLVGNKVVEKLEGGREREKITLYSNLFDQKYTFVFTSSLRDSEKRKAFQKLLSSFKEGTDKVKEALKEVQQEQAQIELEKVQALKEEEKDPEPEVRNPEPEEKVSFLDKLFGNDEEDPESEARSPEPEGEQVKVEGGDFENVVNEKAFHYKSQYYGFEMDVPWGYWFQNFGPGEGKLALIGFADNEIAGDKGAVDFWLEIVSDADNTLETKETSDGDMMHLWFSHKDGQYFHFYGPASFRDVMKSVELSVNTF